MDKAKLAIVAAAYTEANAKVAASKPTKSGGVNRSVIVGAARGIGSPALGIGGSHAHGGGGAPDARVAVMTRAEYDQMTRAVLELHRIADAAGRSGDISDDTKALVRRLTR